MLTHIGLAGADGSLAATYAYEPYGRAAVTGDDGGNAFRFTGREDDGTGLAFYRTRYQDPESGRFISEDLLSQDDRALTVRVHPTALLGGAAVAPTPTAAALLSATPLVGGYRYVDSSPMAGRDPVGTCPWCAIVAVGIGVIAADVWVATEAANLIYGPDEVHWWEDLLPRGRAGGDRDGQGLCGRWRCWFCQTCRESLRRE